MGTVVSFTVQAAWTRRPRGRSAPPAALHEADATFSTWDRDSPVSRLRRGTVALSELPAGGRGGPGPVPDSRARLPRLVRSLGDTGRGRSHRAGQGVGRGAGTDRSVWAGIAAAMVNGGGDIAVFGQLARARVASRHPHPWRAGALACIIEVQAAVATSGTYERGPHLFDPFTGQAGHRAVSATVTGPSLAMADALATALAVGGDDALAAGRRARRVCRLPDPAGRQRGRHRRYPLRQLSHPRRKRGGDGQR